MLDCKGKCKACKNKCNEFNGSEIDKANLYKRIERAAYIILLAYFLFKTLGFYERVFYISKEFEIIVNIINSNKEIQIIIYIITNLILTNLYYKIMQINLNKNYKIFLILIIAINIYFKIELNLIIIGYIIDTILILIIPIVFIKNKINLLKIYLKTCIILGLSDFISDISILNNLTGDFTKGIIFSGDIIIMLIIWNNRLKYKK